VSRSDFSKSTWKAARRNVIFSHRAEVLGRTCSIAGGPLPRSLRRARNMGERQPPSQYARAAVGARAASSARVSGAPSSALAKRRRAGRRTCSRLLQARCAGPLVAVRGALRFLGPQAGRRRLLILPRIAVLRIDVSGRFGSGASECSSAASSRAKFHSHVSGGETRSASLRSAQMSGLYSHIRVVVERDHRALSKRREARATTATCELNRP